MSNNMKTKEEMLRDRYAGTLKDIEGMELTARGIRLEITTAEFAVRNGIPRLVKFAMADKDMFSDDTQTIAIIR